MTDVETNSTPNPEPETLYCYVHPDRPTLLRCNRCGRPICTSCAVLTPTGYRCKECVKSQQKIFVTARWWDYPLAVLIAGVLGYIGSLIVSQLGGFLGFITIFIAPIAGMIISEAVRFVTHKRRSKPLFFTAAAATFIGSIIVSLSYIPFLFLGGGLGSLLRMLWPAVFAVLTTSTVYYRLAGIRL